MQARVQGAVIVECVVSTSGVRTYAHVVRSLHSTYGLDQEAVNAAGQWRFRPGTRQGRPVPVVVTMEITFTPR
jgi:protein TonB